VDFTNSALNSISNASVRAVVSLPGMPGDSPLRVVGESADGGLIWNTDAVSYPVPAPEISLQPLAGNLVSVTGLRGRNPIGKAISCLAIVASIAALWRRRRRRRRR